MNLDQVTNHSVADVARVAFKLVDKLQMEDRDKQVAGATMFFWAVCQGLDVRPNVLLEAIERCALDGDRRQVPEVGGLVRYVRDELRVQAP